MSVTITDNQKVELKNNVRKFYLNTKPLMEQGTCPIKNILTPKLDKWSITCLYNLAFNGVLRFNELKKYSPGISSRMLSVTLKKLEQANLVSRKLYAEVPPKVEYKLTDFGHGFCERILELNVWVLKQTSPIKQ